MEEKQRGKEGRRGGTTGRNVELLDGKQREEQACLYTDGGDGGGRGEGEEGRRDGVVISLALQCLLQDTRGKLHVAFLVQ